MNIPDNRKTLASAVSAGLVTILLGGIPVALYASCRACKPCAATTKGSCAANPCAAKNACAAKAVTRPADYTPYTTADREALLKTGAALFADTSLSSNGLSCASCHNDLAGYMQTFANPYPHPVHMASSMFGMDEVHLDEMVQLCMVAPMAAAPLPWGSMELAALTAFMEEEQKRFQANPCAAKSACAANPCAAKNPCATKNPCAANPCAANPCAVNPCAAKNPCKAKAA